MQFSKTLIFWYLHNKRDLPWRNTTNPYFIWLSEIILQQTRVDQGMEYYLKFIEQYPTINALADADEEAILNLWQGLGYYSRARNLHASAKYVVSELHGVFPSTYTELIKLKGVGDYTASAIASICFNESTAVVDGNVYRVLARYFGISTAINSTNGIKEFKKLAQELIDRKDPATHNQAIMEFGARMCKPKNPDCSSCPLNNSCTALMNKKVDLLPIKEKKVKVKDRFFNYLVLITEKNNTLLNKRSENGIWRNLYEFPLIETSKLLSEKELIQDPEFKTIVQRNKVKIQLFNSIPSIHKLSHQKLHVNFWILKTNTEEVDHKSWQTIEKFPVPILIHNFIQELKQTDIFSTFE